MDARIATAVVRFRLDVNFGDPVTPALRMIELPSLRPDTAPDLPRIPVRTWCRRSSRLTSARLDTVKTFADPLARPTGDARWHAAGRRWTPT
jgi:hypothetical protein